MATAVDPKQLVSSDDLLMSQIVSQKVLTRGRKSSGPGNLPILVYSNLNHGGCLTHWPTGKSLVLSDHGGSSKGFLEMPLLPQSFSQI